MTPIQNNCTPPSVFGGFDQTVFLGCSVVSFSISAGWNEQVDEITVQLIEDSCSAEKTYYNTSLAATTFTGADPGFLGEERAIVGAPVYFRLGDFEFSGLIQNWEKVNIRDLNSGLPLKSNSANVNAYTVRIQDPRQLLENCQVIMNDYAGGVESLNNIINVFGYSESFGTPCPMYSAGVDGAIFGSPAGAYGGAQVNATGMSWNKIIGSARVLLSGTSGLFGRGYLSFKSDTNTGYSGTPSSGMGLLGQDVAGYAHYLVDMSEIPTVPEYVRMNGTNTSLLSLITEVCQTAGYDYYVELLPTDSYKLIKIRTVNRNIQPAFGAIEEFIEIHDVGSKSNTVGRELRNEQTEQLVIGGPKQNIFDLDDIDGTFEDPEGDGNPVPAEADDMIIPYFGLDGNGNVIVPEKDGDNFWFFEADIAALNTSLAAFGANIPLATVTLGEQELRWAQSSFDLWAAWSVHDNTDIAQALALETIFTVQHMKDLNDNIGIGDDPSPRDFIKGGDKRLLRNVAARKLRSALELVYEFVKSYANEYYGKKFQVRIPRVCARKDGTSAEIITSEVPSDGGWSELANIAGLANPGLALDFFRSADGRISPFLRFPNADEIDFTNISAEEYIGSDAPAIIWIKAQHQEELVYLDKETQFSPRVILSISQAILEAESENSAQVHGLPKLVEALALPNLKATIETMEDIGTGAANLVKPYTARAMMPNGGAVAIKSNVLTYGPWSAATAVGAAVVKVDESLVPWEFNGYDTLNTAGNALALEGITNMNVGEQGAITVPGYPTIPLHAELLSASVANAYAGQGPFYGGGTNLYENRTASVTGSVEGNFVTTTVGIWTGLYGPHITGITCRVGADGIETNYSMRTYTPKFGKFARFNAERLKQIGRNQLKAGKQLRDFLWQRGKIRGAGAIEGFSDKRRKMDEDQAKHDGPESSPHEVIVGQLLDWNGGGFDRAIMATNSIPGMSKDYGQYDDKAFMSLDGLLMPISMDGDGSLPQYAGYAHGCTSGHPEPSISPMFKAGELSTGEVQYNLGIDLDHLHPFVNPTGLARSDIHDYHAGDKSLGHHVDIIGRGAAVPTDSMVMPIQGMMDNAFDTSKADYAADYRTVALRSPLIIGGWGYDTHGKPIPNKADSAVNAEAGTFVTTSLQDQFLDNFMKKPHTWPVGPVDLRFDRKRGVWVSPPAYEPVLAIAQESIASGATGRGILENYSSILYDETGATMTDPEFTISNALGVAVCSGDKMLVQYNALNCNYDIFESVQGLRVTNSGCSGVAESPQGIFAARDIVMGTGLLYEPAEGSNCLSSGTLRTNIKMYDSDTCFSYGNGADDKRLYPAGTAFTSTTGAFFETLELGAGMMAKTGEGTGPCHMLINAGFVPYSGSTCYQDGTLTSTGIVKNVITFHRGLKARDQVSAPNICGIDLMAGFTVETGVGCIVNTDTVQAADNLYNHFQFGKGIALAPGGNVCSLKLGAGFTIASGAGCVTNAAMVENDHLFNHISLGDGLSVAPGVDNCTIKLGAALETNDCSGNQVFASKFQLGSGLVLDDSDQCVAAIAIRLDDSNCLAFTDCGLGINNEVDSTGIQVLTGVTCVSGAIVGDFITLNFDSCGLYTGAT